MSAAVAGLLAIPASISEKHATASCVLLLTFFLNFSFSLLAVSNVSSFPVHEARVPVRSPYLIDAVRLITLAKRDEELVLLVRHLYRTHGVLTIGDFDAAGWSVVNTYPGTIPSEKMKVFLQTIGRKNASLARSSSEPKAAILPFKAVRPS
jgi:hypothetical protein